MGQEHRACNADALGLTYALNAKNAAHTPPAHYRSLASHFSRLGMARADQSIGGGSVRSAANRYVRSKPLETQSIG